MVLAGTGSVDVHQHLWTPEFVDALRRRAAAPLPVPPYLVVEDDAWTYHGPGAAPLRVDPAAHDVAARLADLDRDGVACAVVAQSSGLGVEWLPSKEATDVLDAYHAGAAALPDRFAHWAATGLVEPDPAAVGTALDGGAVGLELPATALVTPSGWEDVAPLLEVLQERDAALLVHPGIAPGPSPAPAPTPSPQGVPSWWTPVVDYVGQMHAAWYAFRVAGRALAPRLRVCFALLAGLAPLHGERVRARSTVPGAEPGEGVDRGRVDPSTFVETSSYGPRAVDAVVRVLGVDVVVLGSDAPYAAAPGSFGLGEAGEAVVRHANPLRLLGDRFGIGTEIGTEIGSGIGSGIGTPR